MSEKDDESHERDNPDPSAPPSSGGAPSVPTAPEKRPDAKGETEVCRNKRADATGVARELHWLEKLSFWGQMGLVVIGIVAAIFYGCQLHVMKGQLSEMQSSSQQTDRLLCLYQNQLSVMQGQSVDAHRLAIGSLDQTDIALRQQIARFRVTPGGPVSKVTGEMSMVFDIKNIGNTAAFIRRGFVRAVAVRRYADPEFTYPKHKSAALISETWEAGHSLSEGIPPPKKAAVQIWNTDGTPVIESNPEFSSAWGSGKVDLLLYGKIEYTDIFGGLRWQQFCFPYAATQIGTETIVREEHPRCTAYNRLDSDKLELPDNAAHAPSALPIKNCDLTSR